ncbi:hypothetical protein CR51_11620 [Caballeronia megalochromosomata]|nr:hypothetical protein CR51_11620 [Caballeronia megalochromosomata]
MNQPENRAKPVSRLPFASTLEVGQLLDLLLADAMSDVEVVARELSLRDEMLERLQRSFDRLVCAQNLAGTLFDDIAVDALDDGTPDEVDPMESVRAAMEILATSWPQNYGAHAAEWLMLGERRY